ncbi:MAG: hypothetical protein ACTSVW_04840 [Candidatus Njordarchaeales archaeon]
MKVDNINDIDKNALAEVFETIEKSGESYVIGKVPVTNKPHLYVGLDGWIVAYFLREEPASKIAGGPKTTTLEEAIDYMCEKIGVTYSTDIKYYDFEFPEANKMTVITEGVSWSLRENDFYVTVPGTLYEASYRISASCSSCPTGHWEWISLKVDGVSVFEEYPRGVFYGYYDLSTYFKQGVTHYITLSCSSGRESVEATGSTVLIYKN